MRLDALLAALNPLLDRAAQLGPEARAVWLAELHREQPDLAAELEALLASESSLTANGLLDGRITAELLAAPPAGGQVGPYALVRPLGYGGMGTVWLGRRNDGRYVGDVAIKLLNGALLHPAGAERFRREADALARLTHPNIARLLDAGVSAAGQPYLVLEHVDGTRIDDYCDSRRLSPGGRLALFRQVLGAVAHAHASLVVHRDIKPSNILVTADGTAKLLDFGIAKLLAPVAGVSEPTGLTEAGGVACTPGFAAPEQLTGGVITTATDVYALGVLLYILLAGRHPTGVEGVTTAAALRATLEVEPPRLAAAVTAAAAALRSSTRDRLRRLYAGDLEKIVAKALEKAPDRRYPTVPALSADLDRFGRHEPVEARTASLAHRARKFVRRHRAGVGLGLVTATALIAATVVTSRQMVEAQRQRDRARLERDRAVAQEARATGSGGFMDFLLEDIATSGKAYTTTELLDRAQRLLDREAASDPRFAARMMVDLSAHYYRLRDRTRQYALLGRASDLAAATGDRETQAYASCWLALTRAFDGDVSAARADLARAERLLARVPDPLLGVRIRCLLAKSNLARRTGEVDSALGFARTAIALSAAAGDSGSYRHQAVLNELAGALSTAGRFREALDVTRTSIALLQHTGRDSTATLAVEMYNEARLLFALGELPAAQARLASAMSLAAAMDSARRTPTYMAALSGDVADELGQRTVAETTLQHARAEARAQGDPAGEARALSSLIRVMIEARQFDAAEDQLRALSALLPARDRPVLALLNAYGAAGRGNWARAEGLFAEYLKSSGSRGGGVVFRYPHALTLAAAASLQAGDLVAADTLARRAVQAARQEGDDTSRSAVIGDAMAIQARVRLAQPDSSAARTMLQRALVALGSGYGSDHARTAAHRALLDSLAPP